jgi:hypothetical protein
MKKRTLKFTTIKDLAEFARTLSSGYLMNTNNLTLTGKFTEEEIQKSFKHFKAEQIETTEKVFTY